MAKTESGKQPYHIHKPENSLFAFAGLWEHWKNQDETIYSSTIITTTANKLMEPVHDRMPVVIDPEHYRLWLSPDSGPEELQRLLEPRDYNGFQTTRISTRVNNPANNDAGCLK